jgi:hypothetical protein
MEGLPSGFRESMSRLIPVPRTGVECAASQEQQLTSEMRSAVRLRVGVAGAWMQAKLLEFFPQGKPG